MSNIKAWASEVAYHAAILATILAVLFILGCKTTPYQSDSSLYEDPVWQAQAVGDLAMDIKCDDTFDFKAPCTGPEVNKRLRKLSTIPEGVVDPLRDRALGIYNNWDGQ